MVRELIEGGWSVLVTTEKEERNFLVSVLFSAARRGVPVTLISADLLTLQVVGPRVNVVLIQRREIWTVDKIRGHYGVEPWQLPDLFSLLGNPAMNLPPMLGITEETARHILFHFTGVEELLARPDLLEILELPNPAGLRNVLEKQRNKLLTSYRKQKYSFLFDIPVDLSMFIRRRKSRLI